MSQTGNKPPDEQAAALVSRAKTLLIDRYNLTEPQAHRLLQRLSMDHREPKWFVAQKILDGRGILKALAYIERLEPVEAT